MGATYRILKAVHDKTPDSFRSFLWGGSGPCARATRRVVRSVQNFARGNDTYNEDYYRTHVDAAAKQLAPILADNVMRTFAPARVLDVGCGSGALLEEFSRRSVQTRGLEYAEAGIAICRERGLDVLKFDLEQEQDFSWPADVVMSTEVAEHLPARIADRFVKLLCANARVIVMTAATPGQGGTGHVNEQPHAYWIEKVCAQGFRYREDTSHDWRREWETKGVATWYHRNVMVFERT